MFLRRLDLTDFRNYESLRLELDRPLTVFVGRNAQGKTNILEAVLLLALTRSPRTSRDGEMVRHECQEAVVRGEIDRRRREPVSVSIGLRADGAKTVKIDGQTVRKLTEAVGQVNVVLFGPEELRLVSGGPDLRRGYLNACLGQTSPRYLDALGDYRTVLRQRNSLLRRARESDLDPELLLAYDDRLAADAAVLMGHRIAAVARLEEQARAVHDRLSGHGERLSLAYRPSVPLPAEEGEPALAAAVAQWLIARRSEELRRGVTVVGPHRDDLAIAIDGGEARTYGSQGQQRTAALALKMAELRLVAEAIGEPPLLLLDDVLSELDGHRRAAVMELVDEADQVLVTCAESGAFPERVLAGAAVYRVEAGRVTGEGG